MNKKYNILFDGRGLYEKEIIDTILKNRGIQDIEHFLNPMKEDLLPLNSLCNIDKATEILEKGVDNNKSFGILFDTDTDGVTAGAIMTRYLRNYTERVCS